MTAVVARAMPVSESSACKDRARVNDSPLRVEEPVLPYEAKAGTIFVRTWRTLRPRSNPHELGSSFSERQGGGGMSELKVAEDGRYLSGDVPLDIPCGETGSS